MCIYIYILLEELSSSELRVPGFMKTNPELKARSFIIGTLSHGRVITKVKGQGASSLPAQLSTSTQLCKRCFFQAIRMIKATIKTKLLLNWKSNCHPVHRDV